jgi:hypothetical protein
MLEWLATNREVLTVKAAESLVQAMTAVSDLKTAAGRAESHRRYLSGLVRDGSISENMHLSAMRIWKDIALAARVAAIFPDICPGEDGRLLYVWDDGIRHLEIEMIPDTDPEFYFLDRSTDRDWNIVYRVGDPIPTDVINALESIRMS